MRAIAPDRRAGVEGTPHPERRHRHRYACAL